MKYHFSILIKQMVAYKWYHEVTVMLIIYNEIKYLWKICFLIMCLCGSFLKNVHTVNDVWLHVFVCVWNNVQMCGRMYRDCIGSMCGLCECRMYLLLSFCGPSLPLLIVMFSMWVHESAKNCSRYLLSFWFSLFYFTMSIQNSALFNAGNGSMC